jgi:chromosome segregation ATPase
MPWTPFSVGCVSWKKEFRGREAAIVEVIGKAKYLIQRGMCKLNRLAVQISSLPEALEQKGAELKAEYNRRERVMVEKEQHLASRESQLAEKIKSLESQMLQLEQDTERRRRPPPGGARGQGQGDQETPA